MLLALAVGAAGCSGSAGLPGLGESCSLLCDTGLSCSAARVCEKACHCDGGALCHESSFAQGCPPSAACVTTSQAGEGSCRVVCGDASCPSGEGACATAPDGTPVCVGSSWPWVVTGGDAGVPDSS